MIHKSFKETLVVYFHVHKLDADTMQIVIKIIPGPVMGKYNIDTRLVSVCQ